MQQIMVIQLKGARRIQKRIKLEYEIEMSVENMIIRIFIHGDTVARKIYLRKIYEYIRIYENKISGGKININKKYLRPDSVSIFTIKFYCDQ